MRAYAELVDDGGVRDRILALVLDERERTLRVLEDVYGGPLSERRPNIHGMATLRRQGLRRLHHQQIALLRAWRGGSGRSDDEAAALPTRLLLTVNAIAAGLGGTG
jgi:phosphoenolpyruvate carboxylase